MADPTPTGQISHYALVVKHDPVTGKHASELQSTIHIWLPPGTPTGVFHTLQVTTAHCPGCPGHRPPVEAEKSTLSLNFAPGITDGASS